MSHMRILLVDDHEVVRLGLKSLIERQTGLEVVFRPLLVYNAAMGLVYLASGAVLWRSVSAGRAAAGAIFGLNLLVLVGILVIYRTGGAIAVESVRWRTGRLWHCRFQPWLCGPLPTRVAVRHEAG